MTHLRIEQNTITENVTSNVIHKLYETAKAIIDAEEANEVEESQVSLKGNLQVSKAYGDEIDWLEAKFPDLHITAGIRYIRFADDAVYARLSQYLGDGTGITSSEITNANIFSSSNDSNTGQPYFKSNTSITSFNELGQLPQVTTIPNSCFQGCTNLTNIDLSNITTLSQLAFKGCAGLTSVDLSSLVNGANSSFADCTSLSSVTLNPNLSYINFGMFEHCALRSISGNGISSVGQWGIRYCTSLTTVDFPNLTSIKVGAFTGDTALTSIDLSNVTSIENGAFQNCTALTTADLSSCTTIGSTVFSGCTNLTSVTLPSTAIAINYDTFRGCSKLASINLSNVTSIGTNAFRDCTSLTSVDLSSCTSIYNDTFRGCTGLASITDLSNCTTIGRGAFGGCSNLDITNWDLSNVTQIGATCFWGCSKLKGTLNLSGVTTFDGVIQELFGECSGLQKIVIGHLPLALGSSRMGSNRSPFYNCTSLKVVDINQLDGLFFSNNPIFKNTPAFEALIIRNTSQIPAITYDDFTSQALWSIFAESSTPKIYVDDNLYSTYINHADWSDLASHIEPLSNYVES